MSRNSLYCSLGLCLASYFVTLACEKPRSRANLVTADVSGQQQFDLLTRLQTSDAIGKSLEDFPGITQLAERSIKQGSEEWGWYIVPNDPPPTTDAIAYFYSLDGYEPSELQPTFFWVVVESGDIVGIYAPTNCF